MRGLVTTPRITPRLELPESVLTIAPETLVTEIPIDYDGDGALEVDVNNGNVEARISGKTLRLTGRGSGTAQVRLRARAGTYSKANMGGVLYSTLRFLTSRVRCLRVTHGILSSAPCTPDLARYQAGNRATRYHAS